MYCGDHINMNKTCFLLERPFSLDFSHQCPDQGDTTAILYIRQQVHATLHLYSTHISAITPATLDF